MAYGSPLAASGSSSYEARITHSNGDTYTLTRDKDYSGPTPQPNEAARDQAFQDLLDHLNTHADFSCSGGGKSYVTAQDITSP